MEFYDNLMEEYYDYNYLKEHFDEYFHYYDIDGLIYLFCSLNRYFKDNDIIDKNTLLFNELQRVVDNCILFRQD